MYNLALTGIYKIPFLWYTEFRLRQYIVKPYKHINKPKHKCMKLYTFLNANGGIISQVRAENHDQAIEIADNVDFFTDFYSEGIE